MRICFPINVDNYAFMPERVSLLMYAVKCGFLEGCLMLIDNFGANVHQQDIVSHLLSF